MVNSSSNSLSIHTLSHRYLSCLNPTFSNTRFDPTFSAKMEARILWIFISSTRNVTTRVVLSTQCLILWIQNIPTPTICSSVKKRSFGSSASTWCEFACRTDQGARCVNRRRSKRIHRCFPIQSDSSPPCARTDFCQRGRRNWSRATCYVVLGHW